jgi:SSS family solute:Na+ symporter
MSMNLGALDWAVIAAYLAGMVALGWVLARRIHHFKDYFLAGGALTTPLLVCTLVSTYYGLDVTFGTTESGFYYGLSAWVWYSCPYYGTIIIAAVMIAPRLKRQSQGRMMTISDLLEQHYGPATRFVSAIGCFVYNAPIMQMTGIVLILTMCGIPGEWGMVAAISICALYTIMGGLWADVISDTVQFLLMCVSLAIALPLALHWIGGVQAFDELPASYMTSSGGRSPFLLFAWAAASLTVLVEPSFYNRVFAAKDAKSIRNALLIGILLWAAYDWAVVIIGMIAQVAVSRGLPGFEDGIEGKVALPYVCAAVLPMGLRGLMIGGMLASAMSTIDSYSLLASGNLVYDIFRPLHDRIMRNPLSDRAMLILTRIGVFMVMVIAAVVELAFTRMREGWIFMTSVLVSIVMIPALAAIFGKPKKLAGLLASVFGVVGLIAFYVFIFTQGVRDDMEETYVWRIGAIEIWQDCAVFFALPVSFMGFIVGQILGRPRSD